MSKNFNWHFYDEHLAINFPLKAQLEQHTHTRTHAHTLVAVVADPTFDLVNPK